jgi:carboxyl-terminal processing protease
MSWLTSTVYLVVAAVLYAQSLVAPTTRAAAPPGQVSPVVAEAFNKLMDNFAIAPSSANLLKGGWDTVGKALSDAGLASPGDPPALTNDRVADWDELNQRFGALFAAGSPKVSQEVIERLFIAGMAASLEEGHTRYLSKEQFRDQQSAIRNDVRYAGIGARFNRELIVIEVFDESPAAEGGLRAGDQLVAVNGESVEGQTPTDASRKVRGDAGTTVELTVRRNGQADPLALAFTRREIKLQWLVLHMLDDGVAHLIVRQFPTPQSLPEFQRAMQQLSKESVNGVIIDLRANSGGSVDTGEQMLSKFVPDGALYQRIDRRGNTRTYRASGKSWGRNVPIVVLIDGGSGSMAEVFASAMKENGAGFLMGTKTSGNVAASVYHPLSDGSALQIAQSLIRSGKGEIIDRRGIEPDRVIELSPSELKQGRDNQLEAAAAFIRERVTAASRSTVGADP